MMIFILFLFIFLYITRGETDLFNLRPNLYFGTRSKSDLSHFSGLMWFQGVSFDNMRHECKDSDNLKKWGWMQFNGEDFGYQDFKDNKNNLRLRTSFLLKNDTNWVLRVSGKSLERSSKKPNITLIYYMVVDGQNNYIQKPIPSLVQNDNDLTLCFNSEDLGNMMLYINKQNSPKEPFEVLTSNTRLHINYKVNNPVPICKECQEFHFYGSRIANKSDYWRVGDKIKETLYNSALKTHTMIIEEREKLRPHANHLNYDFIRPLFMPILPLLPDTLDRNSNFIAIQTITPFTIDYVFMRNPNENSYLSSLFSKGHPQCAINDDMQSFIQQYSDSNLNSELKIKSDEFVQKFESVFHLKEKGYKKKEISVAHHMLSNLLGGTSYFTGNTILKDEDGSLHYTPYGTLYTQIPSRSFFPRGFLWDEGFHLLLTCRWDQYQCLDILESWFNRTYDNGYIEREQILGDESRSKVPDQFIPQSMDIANPPTLLFSIEYLYQYIQQYNFISETDSIGVQYNHNMDLSLLKERLSSLLPSIYKWYHWFNSTQSVDYYDQKLLRYRWKSRTESHCLSSGIDDFPRQPIVDPKEGHIDLIVWVYYMTTTIEHLLTVSSQVEEQDISDQHYNIEELHAFSNRLLKEIEFYWNDQTHMYTDYGALSFDNNTQSYIYGYTNHKGYVSLFPFLFGLVSPSSPHLKYILDDLSNPSVLWSMSGIRSLSKSSPFFGTDENYWRGSVWMNLNYLVLRILHNKYMIEEGYQQERCKELYILLRERVVKTVVNEYEKSGFVWESYYSETGKGKGVHPFTGWTTLIVLIMAEMY